MRIIHTSDWHLGHTLHGLPRAGKEACTGQELAKSNQAKAVTAVARAQATHIACDVTLAKATAVHAAHATALEKTLTATGTDLPALRILLVREPGVSWKPNASVRRPTRP